MQKRWLRADAQKKIEQLKQRIALYARRNPGLRIVEAPEIMGRFRCLMAWRPRMESDVAHIWLRGMVEKVGVTVRG